MAINNMRGGRPGGSIPLAPTCSVYWQNIFHSSSMVERSAVNRMVVGSSPTCGAVVFLTVCSSVWIRAGRLGRSGRTFESCHTDLGREVF